MSVFGIDITPQAVRFFDPGVSKHDALDALVDAIVSTGAIQDPASFRRAVHEREQVMSTGIGQGVAIPHVRIDAVARGVVGVGIAKCGIEFDTLDNEPVRIIVLFAMPSGSHREYLTLLASVMTVMKEAEFRDQLIACDTPEDISAVLNGASSHL